MRFRCTDPDQPQHFANTAGHTAVVGPEFTELPEMFHKDAVLAGCEAEGPLPPELRKMAMVLAIDREEAAAAEALKRNTHPRGRDWLDNEHAANGIHLVR